MTFYSICIGVDVGLCLLDIKVVRYGFSWIKSLGDFKLLFEGLGVKHLAGDLHEFYLILCEILGFFFYINIFEENLVILSWLVISLNLNIAVDAIVLSILFLFVNVFFKFLFILSLDYINRK
jgi:hypothetical protein